MMRQSKSSGKKGDGKLVSIVVAARNEEKDIGNCINNMPKSESVELVIVDDASDDATGEIAVKLGATVLRNDSPLGAATTWDKGARQSGTDFIQLVGADSWVDDPGACLHYFDDPDVVQVVPRVVFEGENLMTRVQRIHDRLAIYTHDLFFGTRIGEQSQNVAVLDKDAKDVSIVPWSHALMRRSFYMEVNPPVNLGVGEEHRFEKIATKLVREKDYKLVYDPSLVYHWGLYQTLKRRLKQQKYYGRSVWFNLNRKADLIKLYPLFFPLSILALPVSRMLSLGILTPLALRFALGARILKRGEVIFYPLFMIVTLIEHLAYTVGFFENLVYRVFKGRFMTFK